MPSATMTSRSPPPRAAMACASAPTSRYRGCCGGRCPPPWASSLHGHQAEARRDQELEPHHGLLRPRRQQMRIRLALAGLLLATAAAAQPAQPVPTVSTPVED